MERRKTKLNSVSEVLALAGYCLLAPIGIAVLFGHFLWDAIAGKDIHPDDAALPFYKQRVRHWSPNRRVHYVECWEAWAGVAICPTIFAFVWFVWR
jgi:hypothetical protein